ncbi:uncharacterized protein LOC110681391 [Aedes aegypti]|uniref:DUF4806 domain-containing protein n=1 Tax=Aedes aegypti TaxID=7159 RepID=A0A903VMY3_AEDAE|nr:uncharacterized protein LOC110681391 [Aedes aegypti]
MNKVRFAVVQTQEAQGPVLSVVPQQWVKSDGLLWPNKNAASLSKDASSKPAASWTKFPCIVKKRNIPSYEQAQQEAADLSGQSTDTSDFATRKKQKKKQKSEATTGYDFNHMLSQDPSIANQSQSVINKNQPMVPKPLSVVSRIVPGKTSQRPLQQNPVEQEQLQIITSVIPVESSIPVASSITAAEVGNMQQVIDQSEVSLLSGSEVAVLLENAQEIGQNTPASHEEISYHAEYMANEGQLPIGNLENNIIQVISEKIEKASDCIIHAITSKIEASLAKSVAAIKSDFDLKMQAALRVRHENTEMDPKFKFSPVATVEEIRQLETDLADESNQNKLINYMRKIIGPNGDTCNGQNMSYLLVDCLFERQVLINCSWSGGSKSNLPKFAMKDCKNILDVFFTIVHNVNPTFSVKLLEDFFKQILRNAKKIGVV